MILVHYIVIGVFHNDIQQMVAHGLVVTSSRRITEVK